MLACKEILRIRIMARSKNHTLIVAAKRTPILRIAKKWQDISAVDLGRRVIRELLCLQNHIKGPEPDQVIMGTFAKPNEFLNPAKEACARAGYEDLNAFTVSKVCGSGLLSVILGNALIKSGEADCVVAGGMENLLNLPENVMLSLLRDPHTDEMTWHAGDWCAKTCGISRKEQDDWAVESYRRAWEAYQRGSFKNEIVLFQQDYDEEPFRPLDENKIRGAELMPGCTTITALNSSKNAGGAAAVMLTNRATAKKYALNPLAQILSSASVALGGEMRKFTIAPPFAIRKALKKARLNVNDIDLYFINTAFSSVTLHASRELGIPLEKINVNGDAVSFGHPIGATGAKLLVEAVWALKNLDLRYAVVSLCNAPAEATAMVVENIKFS
ncbi:MAG: thiolase family protein [bacterium]|nr:thiolase family protein [bacterium]